MIRKDKEKAVEELKQVFAEAKGIYLADFTGIDVQKINDLRGEFKKEGVTYKVIKNTLAIKSLEGTGYDALVKELVGPTSIAFSIEDPVIAGKMIAAFHKKTNLLELKAGVVEGEVYGNDDIAKIVQLPSKDELIAKLLGTINQPVTGLVFVLSGVMRNFVNVLDQIREQKQGTN